MLSHHHALSGSSVVNTGSRVQDEFQSLSIGKGMGFVKGRKQQEKRSQGPPSSHQPVERCVGLESSSCAM